MNESDLGRKRGQILALSWQPELLQNIRGMTAFARRPESVQVRPKPAQTGSGVAALVMTCNMPGPGWGRQ